tara:strand:+ start:98 stop:367 length:270 start_codon:yes stop_codon:yes gene_type:complete
MGSLKRKLQRKKEKHAKKDMKSKMGLFNKLPDQCTACDKPFDKTNKEQVQSWFVTVRREQGVVNLYCPDCWGKAKKVIEEFEKEANNDS